MQGVAGTAVYSSCMQLCTPRWTRPRKRNWGPCMRPCINSFMQSLSHDWTVHYSTSNLVPPCRP